MWFLCKWKGRKLSGLPNSGKLESWKEASDVSIKTGLSTDGAKRSHEFNPKKVGGAIEGSGNGPEQLFSCQLKPTKQHDQRNIQLPPSPFSTLNKRGGASFFWTPNIQSDPVNQVLPSRKLYQFDIFAAPRSRWKEKEQREISCRDVVQRALLFFKRSSKSASLTRVVFSLPSPKSTKKESSKCFFVGGTVESFAFVRRLIGRGGRANQAWKSSFLTLLQKWNSIATDFSSPLHPPFFGEITPEVTSHFQDHSTIWGYIFSLHKCPQARQKREEWACKLWCISFFTVSRIHPASVAQ